MPLYFFDRNENGRVVVDRDGTELSGNKVAEQQAVQAAFDIAKENTDRLSEIEIAVRNETGLVATIAVAFSVARPHSPKAS